MMRFVFLVVILSAVQYGCIAQSGLCSEYLAQVEAKLNSVPMPVGLERPLCDTDGSYLGMQYRGSKAFCVTQDGNQIGQFVVNRWETGPDMDCQCARDQLKYRNSGLIGKMFSCATNGNYAPSGCLGSVCFCQDKQGNQVGTSTVPIGQQNSLNC